VNFGGKMKDPRGSKSLWFIIILFVIIAFVSISLVSGDDGDLGCDDLSDCGSTATCGTSGSALGCRIKCSNHSLIVCPYPN
jgi:hypothetical protein